MGRVCRTALSWLAVAVIAMCGLEVGLRLVPGLIPVGALKRYQSELRHEIAERRTLPNISQTRPLPRDDGGPPFLLFQPNAEVAYIDSVTGVAAAREMDSRGFCNDSDAGELIQVDVVALGDSFTFCVLAAPETTWPAQLSLLTGLRTYNLARGGYGPYEYIQLLKSHGLALKPRWVVMQVYGGNDLRDAARYYEYLAADESEKAGFADRAGWEPLAWNVVPLLDNPVGRRSYAFNLLLVGAVYGVTELRDIIAPPADDPAAVADFRYRLDFPSGSVAMNAENRDRDEVRLAFALRGGKIEFTAFDAALQEFATLARHHGFVPVLSYAPAAYQAYGDVVHFRDPAVGELMQWFGNVQRDRLLDKAQALGITFIDLTLAMRNAAARLRDGAPLYDPHHLHFTAEGHRVAAETIAAALAQFEPTAPGSN